MTETLYGIVYCITNTINGKQYVGQTIQPLKERWWYHGCKRSRVGMQIGRAIHKYGRENFTVRTLEKCGTFDELNLKEEEWIKTLNTLTPNGYNVAPGGHHLPMPPEHYEAIARKNRGKRRSREFCENLHQKLKGRVFTLEHRTKLGDARRKLRGKLPPLSPSHLEALRKGRSMVPCDGEGNSNSRLTSADIEDIRALYA